MNFDKSLAASKAFQTGNVMRIMKTLLNGWATSSRCQAPHICPGPFCRHAARDDQHHYLICPHFSAICKFLKRDVSILPVDTVGLKSPDKSTLIHICCVFSAYHALIAHVTNNHDTYQPPQEQQLLIGSSNKAWSLFAEAYSAEARDFVVHLPNSHYLHSWIGN